MAQLVCCPHMALSFLSFTVFIFTPSPLLLLHIPPSPLFSFPLSLNATLLIFLV
eukprot:c17265_g1_i2 orf=1146-1307(+)